jgi:hypothetical protein
MHTWNQHTPPIASTPPATPKDRIQARSKIKILLTLSRNMEIRLYKVMEIEVTLWP